METYQKWTLALIGALLVFRLSALFISPLGLHGDEAQYWAWSKNLDWGYFTKPPLIAWVIWSTTSVFGDAEWAVRLSSPLLHSVTAFVIYRTARFAFDARTGFWAAAVYLLMPALWLSSGIVSTDVPLLLCWAMALNAWLHLRENVSWPRALQLGAAIGFGLLAKYAMLFFLPALIAAMIFDPATRKGLANIKGAAAGLLTLAIFTPNILWNAAHEFATVSHTADNANLGKDFPFHPMELLSFIGDQFGVFGPIIFGLYLLALLAAMRGKLSGPAKWIAFFGISPLLIISLEALLSRANANWAVTSYIAGAILTAHFGLTYGPRAVKWLKGGIWVQTAICLVLGTALLSPSLTNSFGLANAVKRLRAWPETTAQIRQIYASGHEGQAFQTITTDQRILFYDLTYYTREEKLPLTILMPGGKASHHAHLTSALPAQDGPILVINYYANNLDDLQRDFARLDPLPSIDIDLGGGKRRALKVWAGYGYQPNLE